MNHRFPRLAILLPLLLSACSSESPTESVYQPRVLSVPEDYASIGAAASAAQAGDKIVVMADNQPESFDYAEHVTLPADVSLIRHNASPAPPSILGSVTMNNSTPGTPITGFEISNPNGNGIIVNNSAPAISGCYVHDCQEAGLLLTGSSPALITDSDFVDCGIGVKIQNVAAEGHYDDLNHPAAQINNCNLMGNYVAVGQDTFNLVFANVTQPYTVKVNLNYWGAAPGQVPVDNTIIDSKDNPAILGLADTTNEFFIAEIDTIIREWWD